MTRVLFVATGCIVTKHIHIIRRDQLVHVARYTEGPSVVTLDGRGTPVDGSFRMHMWCERTVKMYLAGNNRITDTHPNCIQCVQKAWSL